MGCSCSSKFSFPITNQNCPLSIHPFLGILACDLTPGKVLQDRSPMEIRVKFETYSLEKFVYQQKDTDLGIFFTLCDRHGLYRASHSQRFCQQKPAGDRHGHQC
jgi:hypothetical protein